MARVGIEDILLLDSLILFKNNLFNRVQSASQPSIPAQGYQHCFREIHQKEHHNCIRHESLRQPPKLKMRKKKGRQKVARGINGR
jgi:hypothetical protein